MSVPFLLAMAAPGQGGPNALVQLLPFVLVLGIFYFVILLPMKRKQQKVEASCRSDRFLVALAFDVWIGRRAIETERAIGIQIDP